MNKTSISKYYGIGDEYDNTWNYIISFTSLVLIGVYIILLREIKKKKEEI